ncbi:MAG TPA: hypothetical protein VLJ15_08445 [Gammaproteobacteria bacterium]|nr:hypothetical protein [Gammaproteobacteria bacterium]
MSILKKIATLILAIIIFSQPVFALDSDEETHIYQDVEIKSVDNEITLYKSQFIQNPIRPDLPKVPKILDKITSININALHVPEEACFDIDATLCTEYSKADNSKCFDKCITDGPDFVTYDEKNGILFVSAQSDMGGTGGTPEFIFSVDPTKNKINYLNTTVSPYDAHLSPDGNNIAFESAWGDLHIMNTKTGELTEIPNGKKFKNEKGCALDFIKWINGNELEYNENHCSNYSRTGENKTFNLITHSIK